MTEDSFDRRDLSLDDLVLQCLRGGRHDHALPAEDRRNKIRERLADARPSFANEDSAFIDRARNGGGHPHLLIARFVAS